MKMVVAIVQPQQLPALKKALFESNIQHMTCTNVLGTAPEGAEIKIFRGVRQTVTLAQKVRVELAVNDDVVDKTVEALAQGARNSGGFGMIFVTNIVQVLNVREGTEGEQALKPKKELKVKEESG
jgi:nitrogen regulatory protein PII